MRSTRRAELLATAQAPVALVSSWGSNEELAAFDGALAHRVTAYAKEDEAARPGEPVEDRFLIRRDKNPNGTAARALYPAFDATARLPEGCDLVLVWGEGADPDRLPPGARLIVLNAWSAPLNARADAFIPISVQTERRGHYTNFEGIVSGFEPCFPKPAQVADAADVFAALAAP